MDNNSKTLIYGFNNEKIEKIKDILESNNISPVLVIKESMANMKISDIISGLDMPTYDVKLPDERLVLFNNVSDKKIEKAIKLVRPEADKAPIFAAVTPVSKNWSLKYLIEHMIDERQWYIDNAKG